MVEAQEEEDQFEVAEMDTEPTQLEFNSYTRKFCGNDCRRFCQSWRNGNPWNQSGDQEVPVLANQKADSTKEINDPSIMESVPNDNGENQK